MHTNGQHKKQILVLSHSPYSGGAELALAGLMSATSAQYDWHIVLPIKQPAIESLTKHAKSVTYLELPWWCYEAHDIPPHVNKTDLDANIHKLTDLARAADVLVTNTITIPWLGFIAPTINKPHIWYVHEFGNIDHNLKFVAGYDKSLQLIDACSSVVITISEAVKQHLSRSIPPSKIMLIHQSIDLSSLTSIPLGQLSKSERLLCIGAIKPSKGQLVAIEATKLVQEATGRKVSLTVMGPVADQAYRDKIVAMAATSGAITVHEGFGDSIAAFKNHDVVLMCSENEALGRVTLEALAAGKIVVGYDCPATRELLRDGRGILYTPNTPEALGDVLEKLPALVPGIDQQAARDFAEQNYSDTRQSLDFTAALTAALNNPSDENTSSSAYADYCKILKSQNLYRSPTRHYKHKLRQLAGRLLPGRIKKTLRRIVS